MEPSKNKPSEIAAALFDGNFNCAQSVFAAFASQFGMDESLMLKMSSPFGGGVARRGHVCGAVTGGLMALGLARGADTPSGKEAAYRLGQEFMQRFESRHGSIICRVLLDYDISTEAGWQQAREKGLFKSNCPLFVRDAVEIVQDMLDK
ncbi:MAG: C-GCAxxG-C-C family protein [Anaerolineales bacterium]